MREPRRVSNPLWFKDAVIYELHVKSFFDSRGDGAGDLRGLTQKLDYLQSLGVTALWLLPFYPSPLRDDGYDIADYGRVHPQYGTVQDFRKLLKEAHARGLRVITELVLNHTSDQHEWFKRSRKAPRGSKWRDFYVWSETAEKYKDARVIFTDFETSNWAWDPVAKEYYWHRFYSHQPDLNFDNPQVVKAMLRVVDFWFEMGVDGMRLDAVPYLYEREGTNCENLPETFRFLETLREHVEKKFKDRMLLAEANQWPEDAVAYFGPGNRCHMAFHFPLMPRLFMGSWMEDRFPIVDIFEQTPSIPDTCQWALFLRNHDELTLEMVSDEERDFMYRVYAKDPSARINLGIRRRLAPLLGNNRRKIELMNILLFSLPGTPVIYYGDEIGMGDNHYLGDRNGVRTPMQWNSDRNAGFSRANPQQLFLPVIIDPDYHYEAVNVENQERNQSSLLWWMRRVIATRKRFKAFGRGSMEFLNSDNPKVLAFIRACEDEHILVVTNLSRFSQVVELDLARFAGYVPEEVVSGNKFPTIKDSPYVLTLGFHDYYWFVLKKEEALVVTRRREELPELSVAGRWDEVLEGRSRERLEREVLPVYLEGCRWFGGKARAIQQVRISDAIPVTVDGHPRYLLFLEIRYAAGGNEQYLLPLSYLVADRRDLLKETPQAIVARIKQVHGEGIIFDGSYDEGFRRQLFKMMVRRQSIKVSRGELVAYPSERVKRRDLKDYTIGESHVLRGEQSNTSVLFGNEFFFKLYRRLDEGINPELEIGRYLTEQTSFTNTPAFVGGIEFRRRGAEPMVIGILQRFVRNQGDAWSFALDAGSRYLERVLERRAEIPAPPALPSSVIDMAKQEPPAPARELVGGVTLELMRLLGKRTAELHLSLLGPEEDRKFAPEPFSLLYQRSLYHAMRTNTKRVFELLRRGLKQLNPNAKADAERVLSLEKDILARLSVLFSKKISAMKIRIHGDYHLGQVLYTGNDFIIIDFEGEPARTIGERRLKRSPLRDVAGMVRSCHYPAYSILFNNKVLSGDDIRLLEPWGEMWYKCAAGSFVHSYLETVGDASFIPRQEHELRLMLDAFLLDKAIYEVSYELNNRPDWVVIPLRGILQLMGS